KRKHMKFLYERTGKQSKVTVTGSFQQLEGYNAVKCGLAASVQQMAYKWRHGATLVLEEVIRGPIAARSAQVLKNK
ncbi:MAG: hypothetical protein WCW02_02775, partial [Candidatus Buchananbacteria bacterium]